MAWTAEDAAFLLQAIAGHDPRDSTSDPRPTQDYLAALNQPLKGLRIGTVPQQWEQGLDADVETAVRQSLKVFEDLGATLHEVELPHSKYAVATYYVITSSEASGNLARYDGIHYGHRTDEKAVRAELEQEAAAIKGSSLSAAAQESAIAQLDSPLVRMYRKSRSEGFGPEVQRRIMLGTYALSAGYYDAYYRKAQQVRRLIQQDYDAAFQQVDLIAGPVTTSTAFKLGEKAADPLAMYLVDLFTVGANLAGIPAMSIPCGISAAGLPIGLHLQGKPFAEAGLLQAGHQFQQATDWHQRRPQA
jgi:aspartyl-tRNA(Asn)/glutamyl-tRNA(Gln) amidotransferase subunit A